MLIPMKIPMAYFTEMEKSRLKVHKGIKIPRIVKMISRKKNQVGDSMIPYFRIYYKALLIKTV